jgi:hypothetical protein
MSRHVRPIAPIVVGIKRLRVLGEDKMTKSTVKKPGGGVRKKTLKEGVRDVKKAAGAKQRKAGKTISKAMKALGLSK